MTVMRFARKTGLVSEFTSTWRGDNRGLNAGHDLPTPIKKIVSCKPNYQEREKCREH